jgi:DNA-binding XRE family transcriptional regulator
MLVSIGYIKDMTSEDLKEWRKKHGYTQQGLADTLGVIRLTITRWENGTRGIPKLLELALRTLARETTTRKEE